MAKNTKIYEIAKAIGIPSSDLVEICQRAGYDQITHYSNAVPPEQAEEIRKAAIRLYKPKQAPAPKSRAKAAPAEKPKPAKKKPVVLPTEDVMPVLPPQPRGTRQAATAQATTDGPAAPATPAQPRRRSRREPTQDSTIKTRTVVFKHPKRHIERKRIESIELTRPVTVRDLCDQMGIPSNELIKELMFEHGVRATINATLTDEVVQLVGVTHEIGITLKDAKSAEELLVETQEEDRPEDLVSRPPVIALLGHVDHGKTSILDHIRSTNVAEGEAGGITQDIGAWQTEAAGHTLTFIDTPGHEAFTAMRARGAEATDVVVLVVAADDGVMPQTSEAIDHARSADAPIVIALNKMDRPEANAMRVMQQLAGKGLNPEEWGGDVGCIPVSAITGDGMDELLERIALEAELLEVKANPNRPASGAVMEARMEPGRGVVANVIVRNGTLRIGDILVCGGSHGAVRAMRNDRGEQIQEAGPSMPVAVSGLNRVPEAGSTFQVVAGAETARKIADERHDRAQRSRLQPRRRVTLENLFDRLGTGEAKQLNMILKADVQGSLEPLLNSLARLGDEEVSVKIIHSGVGVVSTSDVLLADASEAVIVAFRVPTDDKARELANSSGIEILTYDVIYQITEDVHNSLEGMLEPELKEERLGVAEVRQTFRISRYGVVAGCYVREGVLRRNARIRITREGGTVYDGALPSLRQEKNDVREVAADRECGINIDGFDDFQPGDTIECYTTVTVKRTINPRAPREAAGAASPAGSSTEP